MSKPYVFNRNYVADRDERTYRRLVRFRSYDYPWVCETDTVSDQFETFDEAIRFAISLTKEPTA